MLKAEDDDDTEVFDDILAWQTGFQDLLGEASDAEEIFNIQYITGRSIKDALDESISGEMSLYIATCKWEESQQSVMP